MNEHNCRTWAATIRFTTIEAAMNSPKVNVWCAMSNKQTIGPYFIEDETINRQNYLQILKNYFYPIMQRQRFNNTMIFQRFGVPPTFPKRFVHGYIKNLMEGGLVEVIQFLGHYALQI